MSELVIANREATDYGARFSGTVELEDRKINISYTEPTRPDLTGVIYVIATGLGGTRASMSRPAEEAARANNIAVTFDYTNTGVSNPLDRNRDDLVAIFEALPSGARVRALGLSMGGVVVSRGVAHTKVPVESSTMVASAGFIPSDKYGWGEVAKGFAATAPELLTIMLNKKLQALSLGLVTVQDGLRRAQAIKAELEELVNCNEGDNIVHIKGRPQAPFLRFMFGSSDQLLPAWAQREAAVTLPFDEISMYKGGHTALVHDRRIAQTIFARDAELFSGNSLAAAA